MRFILHPRIRHVAVRAEDPVPKPKKQGRGGGRGGRGRGRRGRHGQRDESALLGNLVVAKEMDSFLLDWLPEESSQSSSSTVDEGGDPGATSISVTAPPPEVKVEELSEGDEELLDQWANVVLSLDRLTSSRCAATPPPPRIVTESLKLLDWRGVSRQVAFFCNTPQAFLHALEGGLHVAATQEESESLQLETQAALGAADAVRVPLLAALDQVLFLGAALRAALRKRVFTVGQASGIGATIKAILEVRDQSHAIDPLRELLHRPTFALTEDEVRRANSRYLVDCIRSCIVILTIFPFTNIINIAGYYVNFLQQSPPKIHRGLANLK